MILDPLRRKCVAKFHNAFSMKHYNLNFCLHADGRPLMKCKIPLQKLETTLASNLCQFRLLFEEKIGKYYSLKKKTETFKFYSTRNIRFKVKKTIEKQTVLTIIKTISCQNSFLARPLVAIQKMSRASQIEELFHLAHNNLQIQGKLNCVLKKVQYFSWSKEHNEEMLSQ